MAATFTIYKDSANEYRWRLRDGNNEIIADSGEGYDSKSNCQRAIENVKNEAPGAGTEDDT